MGYKNDSFISSPQGYPGFHVYIIVDNHTSVLYKGLEKKQEMGPQKLSKNELLLLQLKNLQIYRAYYYTM